MSVGVQRTVQVPKPNRRSARRSAVRLVRGQAAGTATGFPFPGKAVSFGSREDCRIIGRDRSAYFVGPRLTFLFCIVNSNGALPVESGAAAATKRAQNRASHTS